MNGDNEGWWQIDEEDGPPRWTNTETPATARPYRKDSPMKPAGMKSPAVIQFYRYARIVMTKFGNKVKDYVTFAGPWSICKGANGNSAPSLAKYQLKVGSTVDVTANVTRLKIGERTVTQEDSNR